MASASTAYTIHDNILVDHISLHITHMGDLSLELFALDQSIYIHGYAYGTMIHRAFSGLN